MNQPLFQFNARTVAPSIGFEPWEGGWVPLVIKKSNLRTTSDGKGGFIEFAVEAIDGPYKGQLNYIRLNTKNDNAQTVEIAQKTLSAICHVINVYDVQGYNVDDNACPMMHNIPFQALCIKKERTDAKGMFNNDFRAFKDMQGNQPGKSGGSGPIQPPQPGNVQQPQQPSQWQQPGQPSAPATQQPSQWGNPPPNPGNAPNPPNPPNPPQWTQSPQGGGTAGGPWNR